MSAACAALLAAFGLSTADIDRHKVYELPASFVASQPDATVRLAKACARRNGIHWKIQE